MILKDGKNFRPADHGGKFQNWDQPIRSDLCSVLTNHNASIIQQTFTCSKSTIETLEKGVDLSIIYTFSCVFNADSEQVSVSWVR